MRAIHRLSAKGVLALGAGKWPDGAGLWLVKSRPDAGKWILRISVHGQRREMGLGGFPAVSLAEARRLAENAHATVRGGQDPIAERERERRNAMRSLHLLKDVATDCFEARKAELKGDGKAGRWFSPLELHVLPKLGRMPVAEIDQIAIRDCFQPIWHEKADTARKGLNRLALCLQHAAALGLAVDLQAAGKARALLGAQRHKAEHIPAMDWREVPAFYASLADGSIVHLALRLLILTGVRSTALRYIREAEIDGHIWTVPAERMKGRKGKTMAFRVPLSREALAIIAEARALARDGYLFPGVRKGVVSDASMARLMERRGMAARPHGFRTSLRNWLAETTQASHEVQEAMLAHVTGSSTERAYRRTDFLEQRRALLEYWAAHVSNESGGHALLMARENDTEDLTKK